MNYRHRFVAAAMLSALALGGCAGGSSNSVTSSNTSTSGPAAAAAHRRPLYSIGGVPLTIMDAPPSFNGQTPTAINLAIAHIDGLVNGAPLTLLTFNPPLVVNVLNYQNSKLLLGNLQLPNGTFTGLHLALASSGNSIAFGSAVYPLPVPATSNPSQSDVQAGGDNSDDNDNGAGASVGINFNVIFSNASAGVTIDFNALESIAQGNGGFNVRPVVYAATDDSAGTIAGTVVNAAGAPVSNATIVATGPDGKVKNTTTTDANGAYALHNIPAGTAYLSAFNQYKAGAGQPVSSTGATSSLKQVNGPSVTVPAGGTVNAPAIQD